MIQKILNEKFDLPDIHKFTESSITIPCPSSSEKGFFEPTSHDIEKCVASLVKNHPKGKDRDGLYSFYESVEGVAPIWKLYVLSKPTDILEGIATKILHDSFKEVPLFRNFFDYLIEEKTDKIDPVRRLSLREVGSKDCVYGEHDPNGKEWKDISYSFEVGSYSFDEKRQWEFRLTHGILSYRDTTQGIYGMCTSMRLCFDDLPYAEQGKLMTLLCRLITVPTLIHFFFDHFRDDFRKFLEKEEVKRIVTAHL